MDKIEIPISKAKISLLLIAAILFVAFGVLFILTPETFVSIIFRNPQTIRLAGIAAVLFFSAASIYGIRKLFDNSMGLIIDDNGITNNTNASSIGLIDWSDIIEIKTEQVMSTKFLLIYTSNPNKYLNRVKGIKQKLMKANLKAYGTPISITSSTLRYNLDELEKVINNRLHEIK